MAAMDSHQQISNQFGMNMNHAANIGGSCDPKSNWKNYAAVSAMYFPGFDASAAYSQASALAAAANFMPPQTTMTNTTPPGATNGTSPMLPGETKIQGSTMMPSTPASASPPDSTLHLSNSLPPQQSFTSSFFPAHSTTPNTPKKKANPVPTHMKDNAYWERRKRNNESARRSRESRRHKEDQISVRVVYLEAENLQLKAEVGMLRNEIDKMRFLLYQTHH